MQRRSASQAAEPTESRGELADVRSDLREIRHALAGLNEKVAVLVDQEGFYTPQRVRELSTLSDTEIARRQKDGKFPPYVEVGPQKRAMRRLHLHRWIWLTVRGREWTPEEDDGQSADIAGDAERRRRPSAGADATAAASETEA